MEAWICVTYGVQHPPSGAPPERCAISEDERQYVGWDGHRGTTLTELDSAGHRNILTDKEPGLVSIGTQPSIAIGQRRCSPPISDHVGTPRTFGSRNYADHGRPQQVR